MHRQDPIGWSRPDGAPKRELIPRVELQTNGPPEVGETTMLGRRTRPSEMPRIAVVLRWSIGVVGVGVLAVLLVWFPPFSFRDFVAYAVSMAVLESFFAVRLSPGSSFVLSGTFLIAYFSIHGGIAAAALVAVVRLVVWIVQRLTGTRHQTLLFALFDLGQHILATLIAAASVQVLLNLPTLRLAAWSRPVTGSALFAGVFLVAGAGLASLAVYSRFGFFDVRTRLWPTTTFWSAVSLAASLPLAILTLYLGRPIGYDTAAFVMLALLATISLILGLNAGLRKGNHELKTINRIGNLLNATLDTGELSRIVARESRAVIRWDLFSIALPVAGAEKFEMVFISRTGDELARRTLPRGRGLTGEAIERGTLVSWEGNGDETPLVFDTLLSERRPQSIVVAPMKFGEEVIGAIALQSFEENVYGRSQRRLVETIAGQAAIAIRNAQLFESEEKAKQERNEFLSLVTHEIKNPLTSIRGYAEILSDGISRGSMDGAQESITVIREEAERILRLTEDLLDASKMAAGHFRVEPGEVDLVSIASGVVSRYARTASQSIALECETRELRIRGDGVRLGQVLENLVSNAVKYSSPQGTIRLGIEMRGERVRLVVEDEGEGISPEKLPLIFERFYRVSEGESEIKGTGLGLFITREIVRMHGGTIEAESVPGEGTRFIVELPLGESSSTGP